MYLTDALVLSSWFFLLKDLTQFIHSAFDSTSVPQCLLKLKSWGNQEIKKCLLLCDDQWDSDIHYIQKIYHEKLKSDGITQL